MRGLVLVAVSLKQNKKSRVWTVLGLDSNARLRLSCWNPHLAKQRPETEVQEKAKPCNPPLPLTARVRCRRRPLSPPPAPGAPQVGFRIQASDGQTRLHGRIGSAQHRECQLQQKVNIRLGNSSKDHISKITIAGVSVEGASDIHCSRVSTRR